MSRSNRGAVLVTGAAGFIGSHVARRLNAIGERIITSDPVTGAVAEHNLAGVQVEEAVAPEKLAGFLETEGHAIGAVIHMGAISATTETSVARIIHNNIVLSQRLWDFSAHHQLPFVYASSAATYGGGEHGFDDDLSCDAMARLRPLNIYGWSKLVFDRMVERAVREDRPCPSSWAGLRFFNVYGPNEEHKGPMRSVVSQLLPRLKAGEKARLFRSCREGFADGEQKRDFVYVGDCVRVIEWLLTSAKSGLFNVGTGQARTFLDLANAAFAALGQAPRIEFIDMPENLRAQYQYFTQSRIERLRAAGYRDDFTSLEQGIAECARGLASLKG